MCCLGQLGEQCGLTTQEMLNLCYPSLLPNAKLRSKFPIAILNSESALTAINDNSITTIEEKLHELKSRFYMLGITMVVES
jgi:hypothetical protein